MRRLFTAGIVPAIFFIFVLIPCTVKGFFVDILAWAGNTFCTLSGNSLFDLYGIVNFSFG